MKEIWKNVKDYEGLYQISNLGRVRSLPRKGTFKDIHILKLQKKNSGYIEVSFTKNYIKKAKKVHRLVAEAFIPNPENKPQVNHIDGNKQNNCVDNLEWCTEKYNMQEASRLGLIKRIIGKNHHASKKVNQYNLQGNFIKQWDCLSDITRKLGFNFKNISACCKHKRNMAYGYIWRYLDDNSKIEYKPKTRNGKN